MRRICNTVWGGIHRGEGTQNAVKIRPEIADWLVATYALPVKFTVPELCARYEAHRKQKGWVSLSESAVKGLPAPARKQTHMDGGKAR